MRILLINIDKGNVVLHNGILLPMDGAALHPSLCVDGNGNQEAYAEQQDGNWPDDDPKDGMLSVTGPCGGWSFDSCLMMRARD
jgi:hypothetical protein